MKDNISIIITAIIGITLIVILPFVSLLDRQDSISYNAVLTLTQEFVQKVRQNGFLTKTDYDKYLLNLSATGNKYKVNLEAHKKIFIHGVDEAGNILADEYTEDTVIYNEKDIIKEFETSGEDIYKFNIGDLFYVKLYNTNITSASVVYNYITGNLKKKVIDINYGGVIQNINWDAYESSVTSKENIPNIVLSVPRNYSSKTPIVRTSSGAKRYEFDLTSSTNQTIYIYIRLKNFETIGGVNIKNINYLSFSNADKLLIAEEIKKHVQLNGFYADVSVITAGATGMTKDNDTGANKDQVIRTSIELKNIVTYTTETQASITILPGLGEGETQVSNGKDSVEFTFVNINNLHATTITGPYTTASMTTSYPIGTSGKIEVPSNTTIYFNIAYKLVDGTAAEIKQAIMDNLVIFNDDYTNPNFDNFDITVTHNAVSKNGSALISFKYNRPLSYDNNIQLLDGWINVLMVDQFASGATSNIYIVN